MDYYKRFCDDLKLRGYAKRSRQSYLHDCVPRVIGIFPLSTPSAT